MSNVGRGGKGEEARNTFNSYHNFVHTTWVREWGPCTLSDLPLEGGKKMTIIGDGCQKPDKVREMEREKAKRKVVILFV